MHDTMIRRLGCKAALRVLLHCAALTCKMLVGATEASSSVLYRVAVLMAAWGLTSRCIMGTLLLLAHSCDNTRSDITACSNSLSAVVTCHTQRIHAVDVSHSLKAEAEDKDARSELTAANRSKAYKAHTHRYNVI